MLRQEVDNRFRGEGVIFITCGNKGIQEIGENDLWIRSSGDGHVKRGESEVFYYFSSTLSNNRMKTGSI